MCTSHCRAGWRARLTMPEPAVATIELPPHEPLWVFGVATTSPAGNVSVKPMPVNVDAGFGFVTVKLSVVLPMVVIVLRQTPGNRRRKQRRDLQRRRRCPATTAFGRVTLPVTLFIALIVGRDVDRERTRSISRQARTREGLLVADPAAALIAPLPHEPVDRSGSTPPDQKAACQRRRLRSGNTVVVSAT